MRGLRRELGEEDRATITNAIVDYLYSCNWKIELGPVEPLGPGRDWMPPKG